MPYDPETGEWLDDEYKSPYEKAQEEGRLDEFSAYTDKLYGPGSDPTEATKAGVDLYDPKTYGLYTPWQPQPKKTTTPTTTAGTGTDASSDARARSSSRGISTPQFDFFTPPSFDIGPFEAPGEFSYPDWTPPTRETFQTDPGYEFRMREGQRAMENAASAEGLLRTGGTLKALMEYGQGLGSQEFGNVSNRQFRDWSANRGNAADLYDRNWRNKLAGYMTNYARESDEFNRAAQSYGLNRGTFFGNQDLTGDTFNRLISLYSLATRGLPQYQPSTPNPLGF